MDTRDIDFDGYYRAFAPKMYGTAFRMVKNRQDALDIVQEAFIRAYNNWSKFKGNSSVSTWLYRITVNQSYDFLRKQQQTKTTDIELPCIDEKTTDTKNCRNVIKSDILCLIAKEVDKLTPKQKAVFILKTYEELQYPEIAKILNSRVGTVKATYFQAIQKIRKNIKIKEGIKNELQE